MSVPTDVTAGTITITNGSTAVVGVGTGWTASDIRQGDLILWIDGGDGFFCPIVLSVETNTGLTLVEPWPGPTLTGVRYRIRYQWDSSRLSGQVRQLIDVLDNGNVLALTGLTGPGVPVFNGPHSMIIKPETDFITGVAFNVQVPDLAARAAYDGQAEGFAVLVSDMGDGRSAVFSKVSNTSGDWSDPAYITGPVGPLPVVQAGTTTTGAPGTLASVTGSPIPGGTELDFVIPAGEGFVFRGVYAGGTAYVKGDVVTYNGSSYITTAPTTGVAPPASPWQLLAQKGTDGTGTGDMVGPTGSTDGAVVGFDGTTGKLTKELSDAQVTAHVNTFATSTKGAVPGPSAGDVAASRVLSAGGAWIDAAGADLDASVSLIALQVADNTNAALFLGVSGNRVADSFDALTYVDVAGSTNLDTSTPGVLKPTITITDALSVTLGAATGSAGWTYRMVISPGAFTAVTGSAVRFVLKGAATGVVNIYFGQAASSGDVYDFATTPQQLLVGGSGSISLSSGIDVTTDNLTLTVPFDPAKSYVFSVYVVSGTNPMAHNASAGANLTRYYKNANDAATVNATGYTADAAAFSLLSKIQVFAGVANMTAGSTAFTATAVPTSMGAIFQVRDVDVAVAGTDYTLECSRDNGTTWTNMALSVLFTSPSPTAGIRVVKADTTSVAGQPSGSLARWRFKTLNNKNVELHGNSFNWG